jgi:hypothetical protein
MQITQNNQIMTTTLKQSQKLSQSGSFFNWLMSNNESVPVAGEFATIMSYSDRDVVKIHSVSDCGKKVRLEVLETIADISQNCAIGHQNWIHKPTGRFYSVEYRRGSWYEVGNTIEFTNEFRNSIPAASIACYLQKNNPELFEQIYQGDVWPTTVIEGITKSKKTYNKTRILFGVCDYHYDWTF